MKLGPPKYQADALPIEPSRLGYVILLGLLRFLWTVLIKAKAVLFDQIGLFGWTVGKRKW